MWYVFRKHRNNPNQRECMSKKLLFITLYLHGAVSSCLIHPVLGLQVHMIVEKQTGELWRSVFMVKISSLSANCIFKDVNTTYRQNRAACGKRQRSCGWDVILGMYTETINKKNKFIQEIPTKYSENVLKQNKKATEQIHVMYNRWNLHWEKNNCSILFCWPCYYVGFLVLRKLRRLQPWPYLKSFSVICTWSLLSFIRYKKKS